MEKPASNKDAEPQTATTKKKRKKRSTIGSDMSNSQKRGFLKHCEENGLSKSELESYVQKYKLNHESAKQFFGKAITDAIKNVEKECDSVAFRNCNKWLELLKDANVDYFCNYETATFFNWIANNEELPPPSELCGIDLNALYKFLGHAMFGQPLTQLEGRTLKFFSREMKLFIDDANSCAGDKITQKLKKTLEKNLKTEDFNFITNSKNKSLDPLSLDKNL